jgi:predicted RNA binding protein YcfA (HicA-like mRNA interferase family)
MMLSARAEENPRADQRPEKAGVVNRGGKGSHRTFEHASGAKFTISGHDGDDALHHQEKGVREQIKASKKSK